MKITFLGTSHGVPTAERHCQSMLIETEQGSYLVDAGAPVMDILLGMSYDLTRIKGIFITHFHCDHTDGLFGFLSLACWYRKDMDFDVFLPEKEGLDAVNAYLAVVFKNMPKDYPCDRVRLHFSGEGTVYEKDGMKVTAFPTDHMAPRPAYGYLLEAEGKKLYVSGDLKRGCIDYPEFLQEEAVDVLVVECAHFSVEELMTKLETCAAKCVMPVHVCPVEKYEEFKKYVGETLFRLECPKDGDCFVI